MKSPLWSLQEKRILERLSQQPLSEGHGLPTVSNLLHLLDALLNTPYEKIIITDTDGTILFMNEAYALTTGLNRNDAFGKHSLNILGTDTRMHIVGKTLKPELHGLFNIKDRKAVARRVPLISEGKVLGVMGKDLFDNLDDLFIVANQAKKSNKFNPGFFSLKKTTNHHLSKYGIDDIITRDPKLLRIKELLKIASKTTSTILLLGETGVGKELFAHSIHRESNRAHGPFVSINCGAIPENLLESELFGYDDGAFTGARKGGKPGKFELANGGTIFLDEIAEIPIVSQARILRVLQEREIERVGGTNTLPINVRVIASTNKDLSNLCRTGQFRQDLFYRLNVVNINIPPLRERPGDITLLTEHFIRKYNQAFNLSVKEVGKKVIKQLQKYHWPGNVRELKAVIESAMNVISKNVTILNTIPIPEPVSSASHPLSLKESLDKAELSTILSALNSTGWDVNQAASNLAISVPSLYRKIKKHNLR